MGATGIVKVNIVLYSLIQFFPVLVGIQINVLIFYRAPEAALSGGLPFPLVLHYENQTTLND